MSFAALAALARRSSFFRDALLNILGALTDAELDDPEVGHSFLAERILRGNRFDLLAALPDRQDDPPSRGILRPDTRKWPEA